MCFYLVYDSAVFFLDFSFRLLIQFGSYMWDINFCPRDDEKGN